jgi:hypothetical protein
MLTSAPNQFSVSVSGLCCACRWRLAAGVSGLSGEPSKCCALCRRWLLLLMLVHAYCRHNFVKFRRNILRNSKVCGYEICKTCI